MKSSCQYTGVAASTLLQGRFQSPALFLIGDDDLNCWKKFILECFERCVSHLSTSTNVLRDYYGRLPGSIVSFIFIETTIKSPVLTNVLPAAIWVSMRFLRVVGSAGVAFLIARMAFCCFVRRLARVLHGSGSLMYPCGLFLCSLASPHPRCGS